MFLDQVKESPSLEVVNLVLEKKGRGEKVTSLAIGDPSFQTPKEIVNAAYQSMKQGDVHYVQSYGTMEVRSAIKEKVAKRNEIRADIGNIIFMTTKMSVYVSLCATLEQGSEVLMPDPGYFYSEPIILAGGRPVYYKLANDFSLDMDEIRKRTEGKTKAIIVNSPSNPTGRVFTRSELGELYQFCRDRGIFIIADEAYENLTYGKPHFAVGALETRPQSVISLFSLSKSYSMTGWRAGYVVASEAIVNLMNKFVENTLTCFPPFIMHASAYALQNGDRFIEDFRRQYKLRRALLLERISEISELDVGEIEGAFYAFPSYTTRLDSRELCKRLLESQNVALLPGAVFGPSGEQHLRISFAPSDDTIRTGMDGLKRFFSEEKLQMSGT